MTQTAPYPTALAKMVDKLQYKDGWDFRLSHINRGQGSEGMTLAIYLHVKDSYNPTKMFDVVHYMIVPPAAYDERSWCRWLLDQILLVEQHEACEFFQIEFDGRHIRPYAPNHGPGRDPYTIMDQGTKEDAQTTFRGERFELEPELTKT